MSCIFNDFSEDYGIYQRSTLFLSRLGRVYTSQEIRKNISRSRKEDSNRYHSWGRGKLSHANLIHSFRSSVRPSFPFSPSFPFRPSPPFRPSLPALLPPFLPFSFHPSFLTSFLPSLLPSLILSFFPSLSLPSFLSFPPLLPPFLVSHPPLLPFPLSSMGNRRYLSLPLVTDALVIKGAPTALHLLNSVFPVFHLYAGSTASISELSAIVIFKLGIV